MSNTWIFGITLGATSDVIFEIDPDVNAFGQFSISPAQKYNTIMKIIVSNDFGPSSEIHVSGLAKDIKLYSGFGDITDSGETFILSLDSRFNVTAIGEYFANIPAGKHWFFAYPITENPSNVQIGKTFDDGLADASATGFVEVQASVSVDGTNYRLIRSTHPTLGPTKIRIT